MMSKNRVLSIDPERQSYSNGNVLHIHLLLELADKMDRLTFSLCE